MRLSMGSVIGAVAVAACFGVSAAPHRGRMEDCTATHWQPHAQRLSQWLHEVASVRAFRPENWSGADPLVRAAGADDAALMAALSSQVNLIARYAPARRCPGRMDVDMIWILPNAPGTGARTTLPSTDARPSPTDLPGPASPASAMDMYLKAHAPESTPSGP
jgi:hypothetical protein